MTRIPLRWRVALGYGLIGLALSLGFAAATTFVASDYEEIYVAALLDGQSETYMEKITLHPGAELPRSPRLSVYSGAEVPQAFQRLSTGIHEVDLPGQPGVHVGVYEKSGHRLVIVLDVGQIEELESYAALVMLLVVLLGTGFAAWLGWLLSERSIRPVARLAQAVENLPLRPHATTLAESYTDDGLGKLASAIDRYQARLAGADEREKAFFADASHELRTPIAVIQGAVEVFKDDPSTTTAQRNRLDRIDRSIFELSFLLEALLLSGRGLPTGVETVDLVDACRHALARLAASHPDAASRVTFDASQPFMASAPRRWVSCIFEVLLHKLMAATPGTGWRIATSGRELRISQQPGDGMEGQKTGRSDLGMGFAFVDRLCVAMGWTVQQEYSPDSGLAISLRVPEATLPLIGP